METDNSPPLKVITKSIKLSLASSPPNWAKSLACAGFNSLNVKKDALIAKKIQSRDIDSNPHNYIQLAFSKSSMQISHTLNDSQNPALRRIESAQIALLSLSILSESQASILSYASSILDDCTRLISPQTALLEHKCSLHEKEIRSLREKLRELYSQKEKDSRQMASDSNEISCLQANIKKLTETPDSLLEELILNWLASHGGEISMREFCACHSVCARRVEDGLNRLSKSSIIQRL